MGSSTLVWLTHVSVLQVEEAKRFSGIFADRDFSFGVSFVHLARHVVDVHDVGIGEFVHRDDLAVSFNPVHNDTVLLGIVVDRDKDDRLARGKNDYSYSLSTTRVRLPISKRLTCCQSIKLICPIVPIVKHVIYGWVPIAPVGRDIRRQSHDRRHR